MTPTDSTIVRPLLIVSCEKVKGMTHRVCTLENSCSVGSQEMWTDEISAHVMLSEVNITQSRYDMPILSYKGTDLGL